MLTADQLDVLPGPILELYERFHTSIIRDIARRVAGLNYASAAWQVQRLSESGLLYKEILDRIGELTGQSDRELRKIFKKAGVDAMAFDDAIYKAAGLKPLPLNLSPQMLQLLAAGLNKTAGTMRGLIQTTAVSGQEAFLNASDLAYMQISTGTLDYNTAIREAVKEVAGKGVDVVHYASGHRDRIDVAMRRTVLTGVNQTTSEMQLALAKQMGTNLVQTSAHIGARNKGVGPENHEGWQGRVFSLVGKTDKYPNFEEETGYGTVTGLSGINCRHSFYPFFKGISKNAYDKATLNDYANKNVTYNGKEMSFYEGTQAQRKIEREIRAAKREAAAVDAAGLDNSSELQRVRDMQGKMRDFTRQTGLKRQYPREQVVPERKTIGFSFLSGDTNLRTTQDAIDFGNSKQGWNFHERDFKENYLKPFNLKDDVTQTVGYWGGPEPSFNASVSGNRKDFLSMAGKWGKDHNQQAMAVLLPDKRASGGKVVLEMQRQLNTGEWDKFFAELTRANGLLVENPDDYIGVTTKFGRIVEYWFDGSESRKRALVVFNQALKTMNIMSNPRVEGGYYFKLLFQGSDY